MTPAVPKSVSVVPFVENRRTVMFSDPLSPVEAVVRMRPAESNTGGRMRAAAPIMSAVTTKPVELNVESNTPDSTHVLPIKTYPLLQVVACEGVFTEYVIGMCGLQLAKATSPIIQFRFDMISPAGTRCAKSSPGQFYSLLAKMVRCEARRCKRGSRTKKYGVLSAYLRNEVFTISNIVIFKVVRSKRAQMREAMEAM